MFGNFYRRKIWKALKRANVKISIHDVGSAGERQFYFNDNDGSIDFFDYEAFSGGKLKALGSCNTEKTFYVTKNPHMSSMFEPNIALLQKVYHRSHWSNRQVEKTLEMSVAKMDAVLERNTPMDFLKIDTQGSEYDILVGAQDTIMQQLPIIYCECWFEEVYANAPKVNHILSILDNMNYQIVAVDLGADWDLKSCKYLPGRRVPIGLDLLCVPRNVTGKSTHRMISFVALLEVFGLYQLAKFYSMQHSDKHTFFEQQLKRLQMLPSRRVIKFLDFLCRGGFTKRKFVPKLYD